MNITSIVRSIDTRRYTSFGESNVDNTKWCNAVEDSNLIPKSMPRDCLEHFIINSTDFTPEEIADYADAMVRALILQFIAGDMHECNMPAYPSESWWKTYEHGASAGLYAGRFYRDEFDQIYFDLEA